MGQGFGFRVQGSGFRVEKKLAVHDPFWDSSVGFRILGQG